MFSTRPFTNLFLSRYGDKYTTVGKMYPTDGFVCAFPKGSPLVADVSRTLIELMDSGRIFEIEGQWTMKSPAYSNDLDATSGLTRISLASFKVLFTITGSITATCLAIFIVKYLYNNIDFFKRIWSSNPTVWSKVVAICKILIKEIPNLLGTEKKGQIYESLEHMGSHFTR